MKKILITQSQLRNYSGSEIVTLELIEHFTASGWKVTVLTHYIDNPIMADIEKQNPNIVLTSSEDAHNLEPDEFDIIWIHHYTLTSNLLKKIIDSSRRPTVIFHHMSSSEPLEYPLFFDLERAVADYILYNSHETQDLLRSKLGTRERSQNEIVFDNPAPDGFSDVDSVKQPSVSLKRLAVISNHPPDEVVKAVKLLRSGGVNVDVIGRRGDGKVVRVTPELINEYDAVLTIGKTVQYCIVANVPVYCYDRFGGPGFLNEDNYEKAHWHNFSGRGFDRKSPEDIAKELSGDYESSRDSFTKVHDKYGDQYILSSKLEDIVGRSAKHSTKDTRGYSSDDLHSAMSYLDIMQRVFPSYCKQIHSDSLDIVKLQHDNAKIERSLNKSRAELRKANEMLDAMMSSRKYRLGAAILAVPSYIYNKVKKIV